MIDGFRTYKFFMAIKLHFTTDRYDVFESDGRVSGSLTTFEKRNDKFLFEKIGRKFNEPRQLIEYFVANFAYGNTGVIYSSESDQYYDTWISRKESRSHLFKQQLNEIGRHLEQSELGYKSLFRIDNNVPELLKLYVGGHVHLETVVLLDEFENFLPSWRSIGRYWDCELRILNKIKKFVKYDSNKVQLIYRSFKEEFSEL